MSISTSPRDKGLADIPRVKVNSLLISEAFIAYETDIDDLEDTGKDAGMDHVYVMMVVDPVNQIYSGVKIPGKYPRTFNADDEIVKIDAPPLFPSVVLGPLLLALP